MILYIVRHGPAVDRDDPKCPPDPERPLTADGIEKTRAAAEGLLALKVAPGAALTSPYLRAVQTAEVFCAVLGISKGAIRRTDALLPESEASLLFRELSRMKATEAIAFGHAPNVDDLIAFALRAGSHVTDLRKAGVACLEIESFLPPLASLRFLLDPRSLRTIGRAARR